MTDNGNYKKGSMRWRVLLAQRLSVATTIGTAQDTLTNQALVYANIQPLSDYALLRNVQLGNETTHEAVINYREHVDNSYIIIRTTRSPAGGTNTDTFRVLGIQPLDGRKRFLRLSLCLESPVSTEAP